MKKIISKLLIVSILLLASACGSKGTATRNLETDLASSGYYLDKASLSDIALADALGKITEIKKPANLGTVNLPDLSTIELEKDPVVEVTDDMIEAELERERDMETVYTPIMSRREAKLTDKVIIDFTGYVNGEPLEGGDGQDFELVLGSGQFIPGFEEKVVGHQAGRKFSIDVTFPQEYTEELAGKPAKFDITIKSIEEATIPDVDEAFVSRHTNKNSKTVEEYKEEVRNRIDSRNKFLSDQSLVYQLTEKLYEKAKFYPTEEAVAWQFSAMMAQYNAQAAQTGTNIATMIAASGQSARDVYEELKSYAPQAVQSTMLMDELQKKYKVEVSDQDVRTWFEQMTEASGYGSQLSFDEYVEYMGKDNAKRAVVEEKTLLKAATNCKIVEKAEE